MISGYMVDKIVAKKDGVQNFVSSMIDSSKDNREVKPQTRFDNVDTAEIDKLMANIKKGLVRR